LEIGEEERKEEVDQAFRLCKRRCYNGSHDRSTSASIGHYHISSTSNRYFATAKKSVSES
jgi:hypothetical protein